MIQLLACAESDQQPTPNWLNDNTCMCICYCYPGYHRQHDISSYFGKKKVLPEPQSDREYLSSDFENEWEQQDSDRESSDESEQSTLPVTTK